MTDILDIDALEARATELVAGITDVADFRQGPADPAWTETTTLDVSAEASAVTHLRFHATVPRSVSTGGHRGAAYGTEQVESLLEVNFAYRLRPGEHAVDLRLSHRAAQLVAKAINRDTREDWSPRFDSISTLIDRASGIAVVSVAFNVIHVIEV